MAAPAPTQIRDRTQPRAFPVGIPCQDALARKCTEFLAMMRYGPPVPESSRWAMSVVPFLVAVGGASDLSQ